MDQKLPKFLTIRGFREQIINWSDDQIYRRIREEGLPAIKDGKSYMFPTTEVLDWFKRRTIKAG